MPDSQWGQGTLLTAVFLERLNRFVVRCRLAEDTVEAHLPNPGRMWELLFPGRIMLLQPRSGVGQRTNFRVAAIERDGLFIMLDTQHCNNVAQMLINTGQIPGWEDWQVLRREVTYGTSRFDLLLGRGSEKAVVEVKSCTLFGRQTAMFPDAVTDRGRRHLLELAELTHMDFRTGLLFLVQWPRARWFLPDYHTDLAFARTLYELRHTLDIKAVALDWGPDLSLKDQVKVLDIPWDVIGREAQDGGNYIAILRLNEDKTLGIGTKGSIWFPRGYYLYVGSARHGLGKRLERHQRRRKNFHWHIDYLRDAAHFHAAVPIRTTAWLEHDIARSVGAIADWHIPGFGASDCACDTHLFGMHSDPLHTPAFMDVVQQYRMDRLEAELSPQVGDLGLMPDEAEGRGIAT